MAVKALKLGNVILISCAIMLLPFGDVSDQRVKASTSLLATAATIAAVGAARGAFSYALRVGSDPSAQADCSEFLTEVALSAAEAVATTMIMAWQLTPSTLMQALVATGIIAGVLSTVDQLTFVLRQPIQEALARTPICSDLNIAKAYPSPLAYVGVGAGQLFGQGQPTSWFHRLNYAGYYAYFTAESMIAFFMEVLGLIFDFAYLERQMTIPPMSAEQVINTMNQEVFNDIRDITSKYSQYEKTIPPEVLMQYLPGVISGTRPTFYHMKVEEIWSLRDGSFTYSADFLDISGLPFGELSSSQRQVLEDYVAGGGIVYAENVKLHGLFDTIQSGKRMEGKIDSQVSHPTYEGVEEVAWKAHYPISRRICSEYCLPTRDNYALIGIVPYGDGKLIYVAPPVFSYGSRPSGRDADRFYLNFIQWLLGGAIPKEGFEFGIKPSFTYPSLFDLPKTADSQPEGPETVQGTEQPASEPGADVLIPPMSVQITELRNRLEALEAASKGILEQVQRETDDLRSEVTLLSQKVAALEASLLSMPPISDPGPSIAALKDSLAQLQAALNTLEERVEALESIYSDKPSSGSPSQSQEDVISGSPLHSANQGRSTTIRNTGELYIVPLILLILIIMSVVAAMAP